jgi:hypothetical protein
MDPTQPPAEERHAFDSTVRAAGEGHASGTADGPVSQGDVGRADGPGEVALDSDDRPYGTETVGPYGSEIVGR